MTFTTVFDAGQQGYSNWWFPAVGLVFVAWGMAQIFWPGTIRRALPVGLRGGVRGQTYNREIVLVASIWTVVTFCITAMGSWGAGHRLNQGLYEVVEGPITDYANNGRSNESFSVNGHRFSYSDYIVTSGFHTTASHGGPIHEGLYVRITYSNDQILRLEIGK
jgi:hypothetical protein